jgi:hypothetical protein
MKTVVMNAAFHLCPTLKKGEKKNSQSITASSLKGDRLTIGEHEIG